MLREMQASGRAGAARRVKKNRHTHRRARHWQSPPVPPRTPLRGAAAEALPHGHELSFICRTGLTPPSAAAHRRRTVHRCRRCSPPTRPSRIPKLQLHRRALGRCTRSPAALVGAEERLTNGIVGGRRKDIASQAMSQSLAQSERKRARVMERVERNDRGGRPDARLECRRQVLRACRGGVHARA